MKVSKETILALPSEGRCCLQIPDIVINFGGAPAPTETAIDYPDDYFCEMTIAKKGYRKLFSHAEHCNEPALPANLGVPYLTSVGFAALKEDIKAVFTARGGLWQDFENYASDHFDAVRINLQKRIAKEVALVGLYTTTNEPRKLKLAQSRLAQLNRFVV